MEGIPKYDMGRIEWIRKQVKLDEKVIDIGGNTGHVFADRPRDNVTVVDLDTYDIPNFIQGNAEDLPVEDDSYDTAVLAEILEHVENPVKAISEALRVADRLIITVPFEHHWHEDARPFHKFETIVEDNKGDLKVEAVRGNPTCKKFYTEDNYKHLFHHRFYTPETLVEDIKKAGDFEYMLFIIQNRHMPAIGAIVYE